MNPSPSSSRSFKERVYRVIFESDTRAGKLFDIVLLWVIAASAIAVCLDSVPSYNSRYGEELRIIEWGFTILFTIEYLFRIYAAPNKKGYLFSFYGLVDLCALLPTYVSVFVVHSQYLLVIRILRLMRIFRILKLARYLGEADVLARALMASRHKIFIFLGGVFSFVVICGALMHLVEGAESGFESIPAGIYWAIVTVTTVGYGDISPSTPLGKCIASIMMIAGYGILAVPTGIVSVELSRTTPFRARALQCSKCGNASHQEDALYCKHCGTQLDLNC